MLTENKIQKLEADLFDVQQQARTRILTIDTCIRAIALAEETIANKVRPEVRGEVKFEYNPHRVAKSYNYTANGTMLFCTFTKSGKVRDIKVTRDYVNNEEKVRLLLDVTPWIEEEMGLTRTEFGPEKFDKLRLIVLGASGFNYHGTMPL